MTQETINEVLKFRDDRNWKQFHNPKDLAISISLEAAELLEEFQWSAADVVCEKKLEKIKEKSQQEVEKVLERERKKNQTAIDDLKREYEENHDIYAEEIVRHMIEV